ncbi:MAG: ABC transporter ATP-binding protein [Oscillospiraceae bacterium]|jgi:oligopeptide transport system ATP-binding protein|nr:ABC transporter ATP-binding protein [Oscillospiraceae bacterium]
MAETLLEVSGLSRYFTVGKRKTLKAVDEVSMTMRRGETLGLVGESGCGKSTLGRTIIGLYEPTAGTVRFDGATVTAGRHRELALRMQMIFQDPYTSLNPRMKVSDILAEGIDNHRLARSTADRSQRIVDLLESVGLSQEHANRYPHEFSGGQRQRICIARALSVRPDFIIADEPISSLDVSIQAQVVNLLQDLQREMGLTYLFIAHDMSMVRCISDRIGVMYLGSLAELASSEDLFAKPLHPYTRALLSAIPIPDPKEERGRRRIMLKGAVRSPIDMPPGCKFASRCECRKDICLADAPRLREVEPGHFCACHDV